MDTGMAALKRFLVAGLTSGLSGAVGAIVALVIGEWWAVLFVLMAFPVAALHLFVFFGPKRNIEPKDRRDKCH